MQKISVIIPTMPGREAMVEKLKSTIPLDCEVIVEGGTDRLLAKKRNDGAKKATGDYLLFIDDDNYMKDFAITEMMRHFTEEIGVMGMTACYDDKKMRVADGGSLRNMLTGFTRGMRTNYKANQFGLYEVDEVANAFMIRKEVFNDLGGLDEVNFPIDLDEADFCKRAKDAGYRVVMNPQAIVYHKSQTYSHIPNFRRPMNAYFMGRNRILYQRKHLNDLSFGVFSVVFLPVFVCFYTASLLWKRNPVMIAPFLKGVLDGYIGRRQNKYQS